MEAVQGLTVGTAVLSLGSARRSTLVSQTGSGRNLQDLLTTGSLLFLLLPGI